MSIDIEQVQTLANTIRKIPGHGTKASQKISVFLSVNKDLAKKLITALSDVVDSVGICQICYNLANGDECSICQSHSRDKSKICVVETIEDLHSIEHCGDYKGVYHILGGSISFSENIKPESLKIKELISRLKVSSIDELIFANSTNINGKITVNYIKNAIDSEGININSIYEVSTGIPVGSSIHYLDKATMSAALKFKRKIN
jgi:recombination protein RecR